MFDKCVVCGHTLDEMKNLTYSRKRRDVIEESIIGDEW
jgi:hypothetical protein